VYTKLGAPTEAKSYEISAGDIDEGMLEAFRQQAYEAGLTNQQANTMMKYYTDQAAAARAAEDDKIQGAQEQSIAELQQEFGRAYEQRIELAQNAARTFFGGTEIFDEIELSDGRLLGDHPDIVKMFAALGEQIGEDKLVGEPSEMIMTPQEAQRQIDELTLPNSPYWDKTHPNKDRIVEEVLRLREYL
jgi:predicted DNA-binding protein YlxM (UPF0122 family)